jgi:hypothetical protein
VVFDAVSSTARLHVACSSEAGGRSSPGGEGEASIGWTISELSSGAATWWSSRASVLLTF